MRRSKARLRALLAGLLLGSSVLAVPVSSPRPVAAVGPLPACRLDDILTEPRDYDDWRLTLVDWILTLGPKYRPPDLVPVARAEVAGGGYVREVAIADLRAMAAAARKNGTPIKALSPFRSYRQQVELFDSYDGRNGANFDEAITFSARPGHSEHQTGLTIDFGAVGDTRLTSNWEDTRAGGWMARNAWKYGWLMSYPKGKKDVVCYRYEPWHYRYVGRELAATIRDSGLTIREYLWANHTELDPACVAQPGPTPGTTPSPRSCPLVEPAPTPTALVSPTIPSTLSPQSSIATSAGASQPATPPSPPGANARTILGLDPAATVAIVVLVLGALAFVLSTTRRRSSPSR